MKKKISIIPTGDEICEGIVVDTNSSGIMGLFLEEFPELEITREKPVRDVEKDIISKIQFCIDKGSDLIIIIGGSGGGHRFSKTLAKDYTHTAMESFLDELYSREIYGKNGHMWSKLIVGQKGNSVVLNVPGPYDEAMAAAKALIIGLKKDFELEKLVEEITKAVLNNYPSRDNISCIKM